MAEKVKLSSQCVDCRENPVMTRPRRKFTRCEDCRRSHVIARRKAIKTKRALRGSVGLLIQYDNGTSWAAGFLVRASETTALVQPIGPIGTVPDKLTVGFDSIKPEPMQSKSYPTVDEFYRRNTPKKKVVVLVGGNGMSASVTSALAASKSANFIIHEGNVPATIAPPVPIEVKSIPPGEYRIGKPKHAPVNADEVIRLYKLVPRPKMSAIIEAVRGERAVGGTGNECRKILRAAGIYEEPVK